MADCSGLFNTFHSDISLSTAKRTKLKNSKEALRTRVRNYFSDNHPEYEPQFYIQGSYKMKTTIRTKDDVCDLDDGVYFFREPDVTPTTLQDWVRAAVDGFTNQKPEHRKKCVRTIFVNDYEIDMPVYYKVDGKSYQIAVKNTGWKDDDPKAMVDWFNAKKDKDGQLLRIVKYLKAWCDYKRNRMPSGLAMTILASNAKGNIVFNERDDITLRDIIKEIKKALDKEFKCAVPVTPFDDLFADYDDDRQDYFKTSLSEFIADADEALKETNQRKASRLWSKHLGGRFPEGENINESASQRSSSLVAGIGSSSPYGRRK